MRRWNRWAAGDDGSAAVEFITVGVIVLVPLVYLVLALGAIQEQTLGVEAAARHVARVIGQAPDAATAAARSDAVLASVADEYGMDPAALRASVSCAPAADPCPTAGATVIVTVATRARLPLVPSAFGLDEAVGVPIRADAAQRISRLWGAG